MTRSDFLSHIAALYRVGNMSDSDNPARPKWVKPAMAGEACCSKLDEIMHELVRIGVLTGEEEQRFYDEL